MIGIHLDISIDLLLPIVALLQKVSVTKNYESVTQSFCLLGIRGFIRVKIRMQFINDMNKYRQTSCGVQFYSGTTFSV